jgi:hypothetical protein
MLVMCKYGAPLEDHAINHLKKIVEGHNFQVEECGMGRARPLDLYLGAGAHAAWWTGRMLEGDRAHALGAGRVLQEAGRVLQEAGRVRQEAGRVDMRASRGAGRMQWPGACQVGSGAWYLGTGAYGFRGRARTGVGVGRVADGRIHGRVRGVGRAQATI